MADPTRRELADRVVAEAMTWLRTPYHHAADIKGVGVDCAMILLRVYQAVGVVPADVDPRPYPPDWFLHRDEPRFLSWVTVYAEKVEKGERGDVAMFNFGRHAAHGAIIVDDELLLHAWMPAGNVELCERRALEDRLDSYWRVRL